LRASILTSTLRGSAVSALRLAVRCWSMIERGASSTRKAVRGPVAGPGESVVVAAEHRTGCCFGVERVGLTGVRVR
jgi:hypothetical protein